MVFVRQRYDVCPAVNWAEANEHTPSTPGILARGGELVVSLLNPAKLDSLLVTVAESLTLDKSMNLRDLAFQFKGISSDHLTFATAPVNGTQKINDQSTVQLNFDNMRGTVQGRQDDKTDQWLAATRSRSPGSGQRSKAGRGAGLGLRRRLGDQSAIRRSNSAGRRHRARVPISPRGR